MVVAAAVVAAVVVVESVPCEVGNADVASVGDDDVAAAEDSPPNAVVFDETALVGIVVSLYVCELEFEQPIHVKVNTKQIKTISTTDNFFIRTPFLFVYSEKLS